MYCIVKIEIIIIIALARYLVAMHSSLASQSGQFFIALVCSKLMNGCYLLVIIFLYQYIFPRPAIRMHNQSYIRT